MTVQERQRTSGGAAGDGAGAPDLEGMARRAGWVPEDEWEGKPEKWVDATTFVDRLLNGSRLPEHFKSLDKRLAASEEDGKAVREQLGKVTKTLEETTTILSEFREYNQTVAQRAYERAKKELEAQFDQAIDEGDKKGARELREQIDRLEAEKPKPVETKKPDEAKKPEETARKADEQPKLDPVVVEWNKENTWYVPGSPDRMSTYALAVFTELNADPENKGKQLREILDMVTTEVKAAFPKKFEEEDRKPRAAAVGDSDMRGGEVDDDAPKGNSKRPKGQRWEDLPEEAKAQCRRFMETKVKDKDGKLVPMMTKEKYLADYQW